MEMRDLKNNQITKLFFSVANGKELRQCYPVACHYNFYHPQQSCQQTRIHSEICVEMENKRPFLLLKIFLLD